MPAQGLRRYKASDFSGGLNLKISPEKLARMRPNRFLSTATNVVYNTDGSVSKRWGTRHVTGPSDDTDISGNSGILTGGFQFNLSSGTTFNVVADDKGKVYSISSTGTTTVIKSGLSNSTDKPINFTQYADLMIMCDTVNNAQSWDGTTWAALAGTPPSAPIVPTVFGNRVFLNSNASNVKSTLYHSALNLATDWTTANDSGNMDINLNDGGRIYTTVAGNQELVILKSNRVYRLRGYGPRTGYTVSDHLMPATGSVGTNSTRGAVYAANDIFYTSNLGIHRLKATDAYGDIEESFVSEPVERFFRYGSDDYLAPLTTVTMAGAPMMVYDRGSSSLLTALPGGGYDHYYLLHYDIGLNAWALWRAPTSGTSYVPQSSLFPSANTSDGNPEVWMSILASDGNNQAVVAFNQDQLNDATGTGTFASPTTVAITATAAHISDLGAAGVLKIPRHIYLYFKEESTSTTMTLNLYKDFQTTAAFTTTFSVSSATAETNIIKRIDLSSFTCEFLTVEVVNSGASQTFTWLGYEVLWRPLREIRRAE